MPRIGERGWIHSGVKVYNNTAAPQAWTDLDLSSVVGRNRALVFMKLKNRHAMDTDFVSFRCKGDTEGVASAPSAAGMNNLISIYEQHIAHFVMETDVNGVIQWTSSEGNPADIWVIGYIR